MSPKDNKADQQEVQQTLSAPLLDLPNHEAIMPKGKIAQKFSLADLPLEVLIRIFGYVLESAGVVNEKEKWPLKVKEVGALAKTCRRFYEIFEPQLNVQAKQLLIHVLRGDAKNAEDMLTNMPELLFIEAQAPEYAAGIDEAGNAVHRIIKASPYRAALGAGDNDLLDKMKVYFNKISNFGASKDNPQGYTGWEMARKQFYEQFPDGIVDYPESAYGTKFNALADAITADPVLKQAIDYNPVILQNPSEAIKKLLAQFRNDFLPKEAVTCGHHFNLNDLLKAFEVYHAYWDQWNWNQRSLFWCKVIGYVERLVAAVDAQAFCQGLYYFLEQKQPLVRSFKVVHRNNWNDCDPISYFPALAEMGSKFGIYIGPEAAGPGRPWPQRWPLALLEKLCEAKISGLDSFKQQLKQPTYRTDQQRASRWWWW